ncbi:hypothetical protein W04_3417 [Pseudoalteromonas sp. SW0106-04]|uniref:DUF6768 family protein n=1 Tax=Pseudoalteromonas sp. SW0106-04 TaxID=1702169 RepID=UPI0006B45E78|nr:DUF6768 family protein [Pseudoalteromonas sp. SW0106-04]GAP76845.1 hypothetical protein W04_3417 [Pseudoalteromonas sp. SW0106-04]
MSVEQQIKASLHSEQAQLDQILSREQGLFNRLGHIYNGSMRRWVWLSTLLALLATAAFIYAGYRFYMATVINEQVFWGVWFIAGLLVQIAIKLWLFMEMNRTSILREIKRSELNLQSAAAASQQSS